MAVGATVRPGRGDAVTRHVEPEPALPDLWSRRYAYCMRAPIRFRLTDDETMFVRMCLMQALKAEARPHDGATIDAAYRDAVDRLTFAGLRAMREAKAEWERDTLSRLQANLAARPTWDSPGSDPMADLRAAAEAARPLGLGAAVAGLAGMREAVRAAEADAIARRRAELAGE